jgi:hypothetical protein
MIRRLALHTTIRLALAFATPACAHDWYPPACCGGHDCHPVPCSEVHAEASPISGFTWVWQGFHFTPEMTHASQDGTCHVCIYTGYLNGLETPKPTCLFLEGQS